MCGIVAASLKIDVTHDLLEGLERLSYRGYDSAGIVVTGTDGFARRRAEGKIENLKADVAACPVSGRAGLGHTRWATHGAPTEANAHPHVAGRVAIAHNGIIENHAALRAGLRKSGADFQSETDSEVAAHLINDALDAGFAPVDAMRRALCRLEGQHAICAVFSDRDDFLVAGKKDSPLIVGVGPDGVYVASDILAVADRINEAIYLDDEDLAVIDRGVLRIFGYDGAPRTRGREPIRFTAAAASGKGGYRHFMLKEINEQPEVVSKLLAAPESAPTGSFTEPEAIDIVACGTSYNAGAIARDWFARYAGRRVNVETASEYRYREDLADKRAAIVISQSGETADTLACLRDMKRCQRAVSAIVNVATSSMAREADAALMTRAGPEVGVASTKAFTAQLVSLLRFALTLGEACGGGDPRATASARAALTRLSDDLAEALKCEGDVLRAAGAVKDARSAIFIGRGPAHGLAVEGALKLKEISYIHAEGLPAGELKHGPIALIEEKTPVVVIALSGRHLAKTVSNLEEVAARGATTIVIADPAALEEIAERADFSIAIPAMPSETAPIAAAIPLQLLAYYTAVLRGTDVDQPRNLAKSVTVE